MKQDWDFANIDDVLEWMKWQHGASESYADQIYSSVSQAYEKNPENIALKGALAHCYIYGVGCAQDETKALELLVDFEDQTDPEYAIGYYVKARALDDFDGMQWALFVKKAADLGHPLAQDAAATEYSGNGSLGYDYNEMVKYTEMAAEQGNVNSLHRLVHICLGDYDCVLDADVKSRDTKRKSERDYGRAYNLASQLIDMGHGDLAISEIVGEYSDVSGIDFGAAFMNAATARDVCEANMAKLKIITLYNQKRLEELEPGDLIITE